MNVWIIHQYINLSEHLDKHNRAGVSKIIACLLILELQDTIRMYPYECAYWSNANWVENPFAIDDLHQFLVFCRYALTLVESKDEYVGQRLLFFILMSFNV